MPVYICVTVPQIEHIVSDHHTLLSALDNPGAQYEEGEPLMGEDLASELLLMKIAVSDQLVFSFIFRMYLLHFEFIFRCLIEHT